MIWYQGESNAGRAWEYAHLFPFMIEQWRKEWKQGDFPFYWVQLADFMAEKPEPGDSDWAELREAQTKTMKLPNTGQAVIIDLGEGKDIHPKNKHDVAARLVRWALVKDYGLKFPYRSPEFKSMEIDGQQGDGHARYASAARCARSMSRKPSASPSAARTRCGTGRREKSVGKDKVEVTSDKVAKPDRRALRVGGQPGVQSLQQRRPARRRPSARMTSR